ncbi:MAG: hypothetical protein HYX97_06935 [Chloroflexi bacterium]|nr:hypothetical protein [Chloroflexota bacterium]
MRRTLNRARLALAIVLIGALALSLLPSPVRAADPLPIETPLAEIRGNFTQVWWLDNVAMQWKGYDASSPATATLTSLEQGNVYLLRGVARQVTANLGGSAITLYPGDNYIVWGVAQDLSRAAPIGPALKPALAGSFTAVWLFDAATQAWYGYDPAQPASQNTLQWMTPGYAYWFMGVPRQTTVGAGDPKVALFPGDNLVAWPASTVSGPPSPTTPSDLPNFAPYTRSDTEVPLVLSSAADPTAVGPLSTAQPTYLRFAIANNGAGTPQRPVRVSVQLDGRTGATWTFEPESLASKRSAGGVFSDDSFNTWFQVTPGKHVVALVIDPDNEIQESNEADNRYEQEFTWSASPVAAPAPTPAPPRELRVQPMPTPVPGTPLPATPDLRPYQPEGWGAPFVFSTEREDYSGTKPAPLSGTVYFALAVQNGGNADIIIPFDVEVQLDGRRLRILSRTSTQAMAPGGSLFWFEIDLLRAYRQNVDPTGTLADGAHTIRVVIDPGNAVPEPNEADNTYEYSFTVANAVIPPAVRQRAVETPTPLTAALIKEKLGKLDGLLQTVAPTVAEDGRTSYIPQVMEVFEAGYYLMTGRTVQQERDEHNLVIAIETRAQWTSTFEQSCARRYETTPPARYQQVFESCHEFINNLGYFQQPGASSSSPAIQVRGDYTPRSVLQTLFHEIGHFRQWALQPDRSSAPSLSQRAMHELQAQAFEAAGVRLLEELTGYNLSTFEEIEYWRSVDSNFDRILSQRETEEHNRAYLAVWGALLQDSALTSLRYKLTTFNYLDSRGSLDLFAYMVALPMQEWAGSVDTYLANLDATVTAAKEIVRKRLVYNLAAARRPSNDFSKTALTLP